MKLIMENWRQFLLEKDTDDDGYDAQQGFMEFETIGDLRKALAQVKSARNIKDVGKTGIEIAKAATDVTTAGVFPVLKLLWKKSQKDPGLAKRNKVLDKLMIDPEVSRVIDDKVEGRFLQDVAKAIEGKKDSDRLEDMDMTRMLAKYIKKDYDGTIVAPKDLPGS